MTPRAVVAVFLLLLPTVFAGEEEQERIRQLEERVRMLEERLTGQGVSPQDLDAALERYFAATGALDEAVARVAAPASSSGLQFDLSGELWLFHNVPSGDLGFDAGRSRTDMDYLYLFLGLSGENFGFRSWLGFRDSPRYTDASPYDTFWMHEALVWATLPLATNSDGNETAVTLEAGKVFVPFGVDWDHTWYGSVLYYKGMMLDSDWGARALTSVALPCGPTLDLAAGWFNRSDELDGASTLAGFGLEGTPFQSPEFTDDPETPDREQRSQFVARAAVTADLGGGLSATVGASILRGRIRQTAPDESMRFHYGDRVKSLRQRDDEVDLTLTLSDVDLGVIVLPKISFLLESVWYDRGPRSQSGQAVLAEVFVRLYENEKSSWLKALEVWYNRSADYARSQPTGRIRLPSLGIRFTDHLRLMVEYVSFKTTAYAIDRGLLFHLVFDF